MSRTATDQITRAKINLICNHPFFATLAQRMQYIEDRTIKTACTNGKYIKYNPDFILGLSLDEVQGLLAHEVMHPAMMHHTRRKNREPRRWNSACVAPDTLIKMYNGTEKRIDQIKIGDEILGEEDGKLKKSIVLRTLNKIDNLVEISLHNGYKLNCTETHRILTESGYIETKYCKEQETTAQVVNRGERFYKKEYKNNDDNSTSDSFGVKLSSGRQLSFKIKTLFSKAYSKASEFAKFEDFEENRLVLYGGYNRWGGDYFTSENKKAILSANNRNKYNFNKVGSLVSTVQILWGFLQEFQWKTVLENINKWVPSNRFIGWHKTILNNQKRECGFTDSIHSNKNFTETQGETNGRNGEYIATDKRIKSSRFQTIRRFKEKSVVFDLTTTTHSYIANGIITHNCDYAINPLLEASKFKLPKGALINPAFANMSAEEIYNLLPPEDNGDGSGAGNDPGGCGAVEDAPGKSESEISQDEAEIKQVLAQAETIAKQQGKLPGHLERLIGEIMAPVVNWKEVLSRFLTETSKADYTFRKPSPRYMPMGLYLPSLESITSGKVVLLVDTSGSIGEEQLNRFAAEVYDILSAVNNEGFKVVYVDTKVSGVQDITEPGEKLEPQGGGGTDFRPGFQWIDDNEDQVSACIYLTDGYCSSFPKAPDYPTLWATIDNKNFAPPFGEVVSIDKNIE